ncbi:MAG TPA: ABC transporter permease [Candidatus Acidoferrales bacterium]|nr:ABC transporter permease [Candidatus Acidoferrales bacterium]
MAAQSSRFQSLFQDVRYGLRVLRLNPGFTSIAVLSLALGIGANAAIFELIDAVRMRTIPVDHPEQLAIVRIADQSWAMGNFSTRYSQLSNPVWEQIRDHQQVFSGILAWAPDPQNISRTGEIRQAQSIWVSGGFFQVLNVQPMLGRVFTPEDDRPGCGPAGAVLSYAFWQREFGGDANVIGRTLPVAGKLIPVMGVTPAEFTGVEVGRSYDFALPICTEAFIRGEGSHISKRHHWWLSSMGRLKPGVSLAQANAQMQAMSTAVFSATVPDVYDQEAVKHYLAYRLGAFPANTGFSSLRRQYSTPLWMLLGIAAVVLLIACANLANLLLARASAREKEMAVRLAIGASRSRLIAQLLSESLLIAALGAVLGLLLARVLSRSLVALLSTEGNPLFVNLGIDWRVVGFTLGLTALTCVLFGLAPAFRATRVAPGAVLKASGRGLTAGRERFGLRRGLVVSQMALSLVLLVGALLFVRSLRNLSTLDPGFQRKGILVANLGFGRFDVPKGRRAQFHEDLRRAIEQIPGVEAASDASIVPLISGTWNEEILPGSGESKALGLTWMNRVGPDFFKTLRTPMLAGRDFGAMDTQQSQKVAIVNEMFAKKLLNGENPVGKLVKIKTYVGEPQYTYEIVGLVENTKYGELREDILPLMYLARSQAEDAGTGESLVIRGAGGPAAIANAVKEVVARQNPQIVMQFQVYDDEVQSTLLQETLMATLSGFFGLLAGVLAMIGLYGVISYTVARRTNEIGIRMALGAGRGDIAGMVIREAGLLLSLGVIAGLALALAGSQTAKSLLYGLKSYDPATLAIAIIALAAIAGLASYLPAFRASRLDPVTALREE